MIKKILAIFVLLAFVCGITFFVINVRKKQLMDPWDVWIDKQIGYSIKHEKNIPKAQRDLYRNAVNAELTENATVLKKILSKPPPVRNMTYQFEIERNQPQKYEGPWPQTAQSVTEFFDGLETHSTYEEIDDKLSRVEWVAMLLERGGTIDDYGEYSYFLSGRYRLLRFKDDPEMWASGMYGVAPAQDWETYTDNYIDRQISVVKEISAARQTDVITGWAFTGPNQSVLLPFNGKRVYVGMDDNGSGKFLGAKLTNREKHNIMLKGIHPEGKEIVYIDKETGVILDDKPSPISWETILADEAPPSNWRQEIEKLESTPSGFMEAAEKLWGDLEFPSEVSDTGDSPLPKDEQVIPEGDGFPPEAMDLNEQEKEFFKMLIQAEEEFFESLTKTDTELEADFDAELEKHLTQEGLIVPSEADFEKEFRKQFEAEVLTPKSLDKAMETLERHGLTEGFRRLQNEDPEIAKVIAKLLGVRRPQRKSQRYTPPPKPPEPPKPEED